MNLIRAAFFVYYIGVCHSIIVLEIINCAIIAEICRMESVGRQDRR
jgi:hypothetical protein